MEDLSLVGVHEDGEHLLVAGNSGQRYRLRVDDALRAAVRRDRARLSQIQVESEGRLRPREIQARIRAGETAEEVAETAGLSIDHVRKYEGPVLAEREYVAEQARRVRVRRTGGGDAQPLGELVADRLAAREVDPESTGWDAWRGEDGLWVLCLEFLTGSALRQARWLYNAGLRQVTPHNDEARWLTEDEPAPERTAPVTAGLRRLSTVRSGDEPFDVEATGPRPGYAEPAAVNLLDTLRERRGRRNRALSEDEQRAGQTDPLREAIDSLLNHGDSTAEPPAAHPARSRPQDAQDSEVLAAADTEAVFDVEQVSPTTDRSDLDLLDRDRAERERSERERERVERDRRERERRERERRERADKERRERMERERQQRAEAAEQADRVIDVDAVDKEQTPVPAGRRPAGARKQRRASVPSWDDIVFGQRRD